MPIIAQPCVTARSHEQDTSVRRFLGALRRPVACLTESSDSAIRGFPLNTLETGNAAARAEYMESQS